MVLLGGLQTLVRTGRRRGACWPGCRTRWRATPNTGARCSARRSWSWCCSFRRASSARCATALQAPAATPPAAARRQHERSRCCRSVDIAKAFGGVQALAGVSFDVAAGERVAVIGPNGAGKTTLFNVLDGQLAPDRGSATLAGRRIDRTLAADDCTAGRRPHVPGDGDVRLDDRARKRPGRAAGAARADLRAALAAWRARRGRSAAACSSRSASARWASAPRRRSPTAI